MNYYVSITHTTNHYNALNLTSIAIVSEDNRELYLEGLSKAKFRKGVAKFLSQDNTEPKFYSWYSSTKWTSFLGIFKHESDVIDFNIPDYCRDLKFLQDYISENAAEDFSVTEDSNYPFTDGELIPLAYAQWMKRLHEFLIDFELRQKLKQARKNIGLDI